MWIFLTGVTRPDGTEYTNLNINTPYAKANVPYYIQLGEDWDEDDVNAVFISEAKDEPISVTFGTTAKFNYLYENLNFPVQNGKFARLILNHFSPYAVYDKINGSEEEKHEKEKNDNKNQLKLTGSECLIPFVVLIICSNLILIIIRRKISQN